MRRRTVFVHGGFACDPAAKTPHPSIYQSVAYEIDSAGSGQALAAASRLRRRKAAE
jgi:O-acetylhomoserine/O-acetylserine sulfhydrylase-like pyridoxal-dependent enzyme